MLKQLVDSPAARWRVPGAGCDVVDQPAQTVADASGEGRHEIDEACRGDGVRVRGAAGGGVAFRRRDSPQFRAMLADTVALYQRLVAE